MEGQVEDHVPDSDLESKTVRERETEVGENALEGPGPSESRTRRRHRQSFGDTHLCVRLGVRHPCVEVAVIPGWPPVV